MLWYMLWKEQVENVLMSHLPKDVLEVKKQIQLYPNEPLNSVILHLTNNEPDIIAMWKTLKSRELEQNSLWVWGFLTNVYSFRDLPSFHYKSIKERKNISDKIYKNCNELIKILSENELEAHLSYSESNPIKTIYIYESQNEETKKRIDAEGSKLKISLFLEEFKKYCEKKLTIELIDGKSGKNSKAIRFIRMLVKKNKEKYGQPLNSVVATASNILFQTDYSESDIAKLINR